MLLKRIGRAGVRIVLAAFCFNVMAQKSTFEKPDFAFPEAVSAAAGKELPKAMAAGEWKKALQALVQLTVASNSVSTDSLTAAVERIDSASRLMPAPWKSVGLLLEARLLADAYRANAWTYNQRNLPEGDVPQSVAEWSKDTFGRRILQLVEEAYGAADQLAKTQLQDLDPLVTSCGDNSSVLDFAAYQGINLLSPFSGSAAVIPFGRVGKLTLSSDVALQCNLMVDSLVSRYEKAGDSEQLVRALIEKSQLMPHSERYGYLISNYDRMGRSAAASALLVEARSYIDNGNREQKVAFYKLAKAAVATPALENVLAQMEAKSVDLDYPFQVMTSEKIKVGVNWNNLQRLWLHLYRLPDGFEERSVKATVVGAWKPVASVEVSAQDSVLLQLQSVAEFPGQAPGRYAVIASTASDRFRNGGNEKVQVRPFTVSNLSDIESEDEMLGKGRLYVIDGRNGAPVSGASVVMVPRKKGDKTLRRTTGSDGSVDLPEGGYEMTIASGGDTLRYSNWRSSGRLKPERTDHVRILPDLSVYHPGDTVRFMALAWSQFKESARVEENMGVEVVLLDANYNPADTLSLKTDKQGRAWGEFRLPAEGLLGSYSLQAKIDSRVCGNTSVTVADYKTPGFFVEITDAGENVEIGDTLTIRGRAMTYAGVPVAGGNVNFSIHARMPWWLYSEASDASYGASATTDASGNFVLKLPTEGLRGTPYARCAYELEVSVTSPAGETQQAPKGFFSLGNARQILANISPVMERKDETTLIVGVTDILDHPVKAEVRYKLLLDGKEMASGAFESPRLSLNMGKLPSGRYQWRFSSEGAKEVTLPMVLYGKGEATPPCDTALWVPQNKIICGEAQQEVEFTVGSSYPDSWVLMQVADDSGVTQERWLKIDAKNETVTLPAPKSGSSLVVRFAACRNLNQEFETVQILSAAKAEKLEPEIVSFRDKTAPGSLEKWSFRFLLGGKAASYAAAAATMSDKALDAIVPFSWTLSVASGWWSIPGSLARAVYNGRQSSWFSFGSANNVKVPSVCSPEWNFYGQSLFGPIRVRGVMYDLAKSRNAGGMMLKEEMVMTSEAASVDALEEVAVEADGAEAEAVAEPTATEEVKMRPAEMPLAFFKPDLTADADGVLNLDFEVPDFNTTWKLQLAAWTDAMKTNVSTYEIMARKPVIARLNAPRFVRTGDEIVWRATLSNASDSAAMVSGVMEISDGLSGKLLATADFPAAELAAGESRVVDMPWTAPYTLQLAVVKVIARSGRNADGEQTLVGVLPAASPVIDSKPFYLSRNQLSFSMQIPEGVSDGRSTLEFCGNPLWYCVTALPDIEETSGNSVFSMTNNLFANSLAAHIAREFPQIRTAIKTWESQKGADTPLVSELQKNQELKSVALGNTPWVNDAASQTLRMERLSTLLDAGRSEKIIAKTLEDLKRRQAPDGGFSWCEGMATSQFITMRVVAALGLMKSRGCLPAEAEDIALKAIRFMDMAIEKDYAKHPDWISETTLLRYLYVRGYFDVPATGVFASLRGRALDLLSKKWRNLDIVDKSFAAIVLTRAGKQPTALEVLESMRQFAVKSEEQGAWFDNPGVTSRLLTTTFALQAFSMLAPDDALVDGMRQWIVLQRRTQDWGGAGDAAMIVSTLLQSGSDWTDVKAPSVSIGGKELPQSEFEKFTSSGFFELRKEDAGKELRVERQEGVPAWGGVMIQSVVPIADVKAADVPDLKISKEIFAVDETANGTELSRRPLKVGDKVRVMLTLTASRRIDYVAVTDERSACLEPVEQLSGYEWRDGTGYYREVRDASTQLFISQLDKGVHELWYDCYVGQEGEFSCGIATAQSLQAPLITAHSGGSELKISNQ